MPYIVVTKRPDHARPKSILGTHGGRLLYKYERGDVWKARRGRGSLLPGSVGMGQANAQASLFRLERVR